MQIKKKMENFFVEDKFYNSIEELIEELEEEYDCSIEEFVDDFFIEITKSELKPILVLSIDDINTDSDNYSEDNEDSEYFKIIKVLKENIDFEKINSLMPKNYHRTKEKVILSKSDLIDMLNN